MAVYENQTVNWLLSNINEIMNKEDETNTGENHFKNSVTEAVNMLAELLSRNNRDIEALKLSDRVLTSALNRDGFHF